LTPPPDLPARRGGTAELTPPPDLPARRGGTAELTPPPDLPARRGGTAELTPPPDLPARRGGTAELTPSPDPAAISGALTPSRQAEGLVDSRLQPHNLIVRWTSNTWMRSWRSRPQDTSAAPQPRSR